MKVFDAAADLGRMLCSEHNGGSLVPGPVISVLQAMKNWVGPGNEATVGIQIG